MSKKLMYIDPDVSAIHPVFYGTEVPVKNFFDYLKLGESVDAFLEDFNTVKRDQVMQLLDLSFKQVMATPF